MNFRMLLCLGWALSGCTLTLTGEPADDVYLDVYEDDWPPPARAWDDGDATDGSPVTAGAGAPTFLPSDRDDDDAAAQDLRDLTIRMTDLDEDVHRFMKLRIASRDGRDLAVGIIHQGIPSADYTFSLPRTLRGGLAYTLSLYADTDGSGGYSGPSNDHTWSIPIPAGYGDVTVDLPSTPDYVDIERDAPEPARGLVVSFHDMQEYYQHPLDVRVTERATGRLVGRQVRQVPGDGFDLNVGGVIRPGVAYQIDVAVDIDEDGHYDPVIDDSWRVTGVADSDGLALNFAPNGPYVDVGF